MANKDRSVKALCHPFLLSPTGSVPLPWGKAGKKNSIFCVGRQPFPVLPPTAHSPATHCAHNKEQHFIATPSIRPSTPPPFILPSGCELFFTPHRIIPLCASFEDNYRREQALCLPQSPPRSVIAGRVVLLSSLTCTGLVLTEFVRPSGYVSRFVVLKIPCLRLRPSPFDKEGQGCL